MTILSRLNINVILHIFVKKSVNFAIKTVVKDYLKAIKNIYVKAKMDVNINVFYVILNVLHKIISMINWLNKLKYGNKINKQIKKSKSEESYIYAVSSIHAMRIVSKMVFALINIKTKLKNGLKMDAKGIIITHNKYKLEINA
jgi:hypothetical protein